MPRVEHKNSQEVTNDHCENKTGVDNHSKNVADDSSKKDETAIPTSSSKSEEDSLNMEELAINSNLANEYALDGEVGKRISDMVPIPVSITSAKLYDIALKIKIKFLPALSK